MTDTEKLAAAEDTIRQLRYIVDQWLERNKMYTRLQYGKQEILRAREILDSYLAIDQRGSSSF